jgi:glycosyltransferase involved in cell wall biosynthesis
MLKEKTPKVSVCVVTYNQEKYIRQCLQSIVDQETDFDFEIIVGNDCSTDGTRAIVQEFANKYPDMVKPIFHEKNIGAYKNFLFVHTKTTGEYIAHMDGDDYMLPSKLQVQVHFLDLHQECNVVFHRVKVLYEQNGVLLDDLTDVKIIPKGGYTQSAILRHVSVGANSSKMYRASVKVKEYPEFNIVDYFENVEQVGTGKACFVSEDPYGVYRAGIGIASSGSSTRLALCNSFLYFAKKYPEDRKNVNAAALLLFLADLKNKRPTWREFCIVWIKTFHPMSVIVLFQNRRITKMLRLPKYKDEE